MSLSSHVVQYFSEDKLEDSISDPLHKFVSENSDNCPSLAVQVTEGQATKMSSVFPTMWLGSQDGQ